MAPVDDFGQFGKIHIPPGFQKPCGTSQWGEGVLAVRSEGVDPANPNTFNYDDYPLGIAADGYGGAFVLSMVNEHYPASQGPIAMRPVSASGKAGPLVRYGDPVWWIGVLGQWAEAAIVPSGKGKCIVVWGKDYQFDYLRAQRYNQNARPLWRGGSKGILASKEFTKYGALTRNNLIAEPDGADGVLACWIDQWHPPTSPIFVQRVRSNGSTAWGANGISFGAANNPNASGALPASWVQLVPDQKGGAIVVSPEVGAGAIDFVAYRINASGVLTGAPLTLVSAPEQWIANRRLRRAVTDGAGGLYLGYTNAASELRVLRYSSTNQILWDNAVGMPVHPKAFQIREDGAGGILVASVSGGSFARPELRRIAASGGVTWDINVPPTFNQPQITLPPASLFFDEAWAFVLQPVPDGSGGAVLVLQDWIVFKRFAAPKLFSVCYDSNGTALGASQEITSRASAQDYPLVVPGLGGALVAWADNGDQSVSGQDVWIQRAGCCVQTGLEYSPPVPCEILPIQGIGFGDMGLQLPCGNEDRQFGVIPLTRLFQNIRGLDFPPSMLNRDVPPPAWMRMIFSGLPEGTTVQLFSLKGKKVAEAETGIAGSVLTFEPSKEDQLLIFSNTTRLERGAIHRVHLRSEWGDGQPTALRFRKTRRTAKTPRTRKRKPKR